MKLHRDYDLYIGAEPPVYRGGETDWEMFYVLDGIEDLTIGNNKYEMIEGDIVLKNQGKQRTMHGKKDQLLFALRLSRQILSELGGKSLPYFSLNTVKNPHLDVQEIRGILQEIIFSKLYRSEKNDACVCSCIYKLMAKLLEDYTISGEEGVMLYGDEKTNQLVTYIYEHYSERISMDTLAEKMFSSKSTLSRTFKKNTGEYFGDYLLRIRLEQTVRRLVYTDDSITRIAYDCGFSNVSTLNRVFREKYGMPPTEYRSEQKKEVEKEMQCDQDRQALLEKKLKKLTKSFAEAGKSNVRNDSDVDVKTTEPFEQFWNVVINMGSVHRMTLSNMQFHAVYLSENLGFKYVRIWNVFSKKLMLTDGKENSEYNYDIVDSVLDFIVGHGMRPFIDFSKRPETAVYTAGKTVFYENDYIDFESKAAWQSMVRDFFRHIQRRYGKEEICTWIFELGNDSYHERNYPYPSETKDYFEVYLYLYQTIRIYAPTSMFGGPSITHEVYTEEGLRRFLKKCNEEGCRPDFTSVMVFPFAHEEMSPFPDVGEINETIYKELPDMKVAENMIKSIRKIQRECGLTDCRIFISEINSTISNRNFINDSCYRGIWMINNIMKFRGLADVCCCWMGSDWISSHYDSRSICNGASGILTKDTIRKPVYFALFFMNQLGKELIRWDDGCIITKKSDTDYVILCYNEKKLMPGYYLKESQASNPIAIKNVFSDYDSKKFHIRLNGVTNSNYKVKIARINRTRGSILAEWERFGNERDLKRSDIKYIEAVSIPFQERCMIKAERNVLEIDQTLADQEMVLIQISDED